MAIHGRNVSIICVGAIYVYCWHVILFCLDSSCSIILDTWWRSLDAQGCICWGIGDRKWSAQVGGAHAVLTRPGTEQHYNFHSWKQTGMVISLYNYLNKQETKLQPPTGTSVVLGL